MHCSRNFTTGKSFTRGLKIRETGEAYMHDIESRTALAKTLVEQVTEQLKDLPSIAFTEEGNRTVMIATAGESVLHFSLQEHAEQCITENETSAGLMFPDNAEGLEQYVHEHAFADLFVTVLVIAKHLSTALWILSKVAGVKARENKSPFFDYVQTGLKFSALSQIDGKLREMLDLSEEVKDYPHPKKYVINDKQMIDALRSLKRFSIAGVARSLGYTDANARSYVYNYLEQKNMTPDELKQEWERLSRGAVKKTG